MKSSLVSGVTWKRSQGHDSQNSPRMLPLGLSFCWNFQLCGTGRGMQRKGHSGESTTGLLCNVYPHTHCFFPFSLLDQLSPIPPCSWPFTHSHDLAGLRCDIAYTRIRECILACVWGWWGGGTDRVCNKLWPNTSELNSLHCQGGMACCWGMYVFPLMHIYINCLLTLWSNVTTLLLTHRPIRGNRLL